MAVLVVAASECRAADPHEVLRKAFADAGVEPSMPLGRRKIALVEEVIATVATHYIEPRDDTKLTAQAARGLKDMRKPADLNQITRAAIDAVLGGLDSSTFYFASLSPAEQAQAGIGAAVSPRAGEVVVITPYDGSPAERAGLRPGDRITHADGKPLAGLRFDQAVSLLRGPAGSSVTLTVTRSDGNGKQISAQREALAMPEPTVRRQGGVIVLRIPTLATGTADKTAAQLAAALNDGAGAKGVIVDLRRNSGEQLAEAIAVADIFLDDGVITGLLSRSEPPRTFTAARGQAVPGLPVAVVIDEGTAAAAEVLAAALKDNRRALLVGRPTAGHGRFTREYKLSEGVLWLTQGQYARPSGTPIERVGIDPDLVAADDAISRAMETLAKGR
ncbi:MAG: PDZ domain-containing protein [Magnetospirillum sp.]|nr:PDZ domain-containing protein [Magnetospirillum sp.]